MAIAVIFEDQSEIIAFLSRPDAYAGPVDRVERIETHISIVFLAGDRAYKLKRAVRFPYCDFSTPELRRQFCEAEVRINRRTAPGLYRGVVPVGRDRDGSLTLGGGQPVDWLVEMERFDQSLLLDRLAANGRLDRYSVESVADAIAEFHQRAEGCAEISLPRVIAAIIDNNDRCFRECAPGIIDRQAAAVLGDYAHTTLTACAQTLDRRGRSGSVRRCHGDLHLRNIVIHEGRPLLFDAIEFSEELTCIDVLYDLAFLVMDLDSRNLRPLASIVLNRYLDNTGDSTGLAALPLFLSLRAAIRCHVDAAMAATISDPAESEALKAQARRYLDLALAYLMPRPRLLIAIGGLSGSGKSRLARDLAPLVGAVPGARIVRTDSTRKRLAGVPLGSRLDPDTYSREAARRTYASVFEEVRSSLDAGRSVIADGVFAGPEERNQIAQIAASCGVPFQGLWLEASPHLLEERVTRRRHNVSDATAAVVRMQVGYDLGAISWRRLDTSGSEAETLANACGYLGLVPV